MTIANKIEEKHQKENAITNYLHLHLNVINSDIYINIIYITNFKCLHKKYISHT
jgi:hypothetical protein